MKKVITLIIFSTVFLFANENGRFAGSFTRMGLGARSLAMGNTGVAAPSNSYSFYYNPALSGKLKKKVFSNSYTFLSQDRHAYFLGFSMKVPPGAGLSLGWLKTGTDDLYSYNSIGEKSREVNHSAHALYGSFARHFEKLSIGATVKVMFEFLDNIDRGVDYSSTGVGGDFGVFYQATESLGLGVVYKDVGSQLKANTSKIFELGGNTYDDFPNLLRAGGYYKSLYYDWLNVAYDFEYSSKKEYTNHFGFEALHKRNIAVRMGFIDFKDDLDERAIQFTAGAGFDFILYKFTSHLDYAFIGSKSDEGSSHLFSWEFYF